MTGTYITYRNLDGILAAVMLEHGLSRQALPQGARSRRLVTFMKDYGTESMNKDWIIRHLKWMDEAMKRVPISDSIRRVMTMQNVERKRINLLSIGECTLPSLIFFSFSNLQMLIGPLLDGGSSGLPALFTTDEILSRLAFDLKLDEELMAWRHFELMIGTGRGG